MPKVSVIVPVYGVEKYIVRCACSLFEQTLDDIEYLFINDCTKDRSIEYLIETLEKYPARKTQVKIINMPKNSGQAEVRKCGMHLASGDYIIHCDSDDWVDTHAYEFMYKKAIEGNYDIVFCDYFESDGGKHIIKERNFGNKDIIFTVVQKEYWQIWSAMVNRNIITQNAIVYPTANSGEDFALMIQMLYYTNKYFHVRKALYFYYHNPSSITNESSIDGYKKRFVQAYENTNLIIDFFRWKDEYISYSDVLILLKLYCRRCLSPLAYIKEYRNIWFSVYPELERENLMFNKNIPINLKISYYSVRMGIYKYLKLIRKVSTQIRAKF